MSKWKFNDHTLPGLPEEWNQIAYPNLVVIKGTGTDDPANAFKFWLVCSGEEFTALDVNGTNCVAMLPYVVVHQFLYIRGDETWLWQDKGSIIVEDMEALYEENLLYYYFNPDKTEYIWCNNDIKDSGGNVIFEGSEPVLVEADPEPEVTETRDLRSHCLGIALELMKKALPIPKAKTIIGYLYNGVKLPPLPEWDKTAYPYAMIHVWNNGGATLYVSWVVPENVPGVSQDFVEYGIGNKLELYKLENNSWVFKESTTSGGGYSVATSSLLWVNFNLRNSDNSIYLAASDPIPIYA